MTKKLQVSLRRNGSAIAVYPVRVDHPSHIERGLSEALTQFAYSVPDAVIGENGVTLTTSMRQRVYTLRMAITYDTIGSLTDEGYRLKATSCSCWHSKDLDLPALAEELGRGHSSMRDQLPKLRC